MPDPIETSSRLRSSLWPVTVVATRYGGVYEGGSWAAFNLEPQQIPLEAADDDCTCSEWWARFGRAVGVGDAPADAVADLEAKHAAGYRLVVPYRAEAELVTPNA